MNENILAVYQQILTDVLNGRNLEKHLKDVESAIVDIDTTIEQAEKNGNDFAGFEKFKNELYFLKYQILEQL